MIRPLTGPLLDVPLIPEAEVLEWAERGKRVVFSFARQGNGMTCHFAAARDSLRDLKDAVRDMGDWLFFAYPWCEMLFCVTSRASIERIVKKCGFGYLCTQGPYRVWMLRRNHLDWLVA